MTTIGLDYSWSRPDVLLIKDRGYTFVMRYLSHTPGKNIDANEFAALTNAGIKVGVVWETTANRALSGFVGGQQDAADAIAQQSPLGIRSAIYFAVDFGATGSQLDAVKEYFRGVSSVLLPERTGVYGSYDVVKTVLDAGYAQYVWQTSAWSAGKFETRSHIYQNGNKSSGIPGTDWNLGNQDNMGLHGDLIVVTPPAPVPTPTPAPTPPPPPPPPPAPSAPPFPLPAGHWFGLPSPDSRNHSGSAWPSDRPKIAMFQQKLKDRGWAIGPNGHFDSQTDKIVRAFQQEKGLTVDGKVGPLTWSAIWTAPVTK